MRKFLTLLLLLPLAAANPTTTILFDTPATLEGSIAGTSSGAFSLTGSDAGSLTLTGERIVFEQAGTAYSRGIDGVVVFANSPLDPTWVEVGSAGAGAASLDASGKWGLRVIGGDHEWTSARLQARDVVPPSTMSAAIGHEHAPYPQVLAKPVQPMPTVVSLINDASSIRVSGSFVVELFGWNGSLERSSTDEVQSGYAERQQVPTGDSYWIASYARIAVSAGELAIDALDTRMALVSPQTDLELNGTLHLPLTQGNLPGGLEAADGTWHAEGLMGIGRMEPGTDRQVRATIAAEDATILVDGQPTAFLRDPAVAATAIGVVAVALAVLKALPGLTALLTRLPPDKALENDNRRKLYDYIIDHPGATFREVLRGTDMAAGTARHHLTVLARSKMIVEHGHRATLRFFENHGKFDGTWTSVVLLRESELSRVYRWLEAHPNAMQRELLEHAEATWSWSRSTTQHRLARLIDGGLVSVQQAGRRKFYHAIEPEAAEPLPAKTSWT